MSELESESRQPRDGAQAPWQSYKVKMDLEGFRDLFGAQNGLYMRKIAVMLLVCDLPFTLALLWGGAYTVSLELLASTVMCVALVVLAILMLVRPAFCMRSRGGDVRGWFMRHGVKYAQMQPLDELRARYTVELGPLGVSEDSDLELERTPWFAFREKPVRGRHGTCFVLDTGKQSSLLYNMIGINWAFREEGLDGALFVPDEVIARDPGIVGRISSAISDARAQGTGAHKTGEIEEWLRAAGPKA